MLRFKNNFRGYFSFYYKIVGNRLLFFLFLSILVGALDGIGLTMLIPLLQSVAGQPGNAQNSMGQLRYLTDMIHAMGLPLNVTVVLVAMAGLFAIKGVIRFFQLSYYAGLRQLFIKKIRYSLVDSLQRLSFTAFTKMDAGKIQNTLTVDVQRLFQTMKFYFDTAQAFAMLCTYMVLAVLANYQFALLVGVGAALSNLIYKRVYKATKKASVDLSARGSDFHGFLSQTTTYFKYLKSTNTFSRYTPKLKEVINQTEQLNLKIGRLNAITVSVKEPMIMLIVACVILMQVNWMGASLGSIILSLLLFYRALTYLVGLQNSWQGFIENIGGMNAVATMIDELDDMKEATGSVEFTALKEQISFRNVEFAYDKKLVLDNVSISLPKRKTIALVGESGSGKTTIANMIAGLLLPDKGDIFVDNVSMRHLNLDSYRNKIGYISQESVIFSDTIYNNITFWADRTADNIARFNEVIRLASLEDFVQSNPSKENGMLGDNGILISGGQRQRISIARELFKKTEILIFDEATSALDSETERIIQQNIEKLYGNFTMILIAHRLSTIIKADIIYLVEQGKISASGSFSEMMKGSSRFQKLASLQTF